MTIGRLLFIAYAILVGYLSLRQGESSLVANHDKSAHFLTYAVFALLVVPLAPLRRHYFYAAAGVVLYSALLELAQSFVPGRMMSGYDLLANVAGVTVGALVAFGCGKLPGTRPAG